MEKAVHTPSGIVALFVVIGLVLSLPGVAQTFQERPITAGLREFTAYPLTAGSLQIGNIVFPFDSAQLRWLALDFGLTNNFQIGTALAANFLGRLNLLGKYRFLHLDSGMDLALPFSIDVVLAPPRTLAFGTGAILSWQFSASTSFHSGIWLALTNEPRVGVSALYLIADVELTPNSKLLFELDLYPLVADLVQISLGELQRFGFINVRVAATLLLPTANNVLSADVFFRF
jgi:hypothetical protein